MASLASAPGRFGGPLRQLDESRWGVLVPTALAALLGVIGLGDKSMWLDEAFSASLVRLPTSDMLVYMWRNEQQASPYHLVLQAWSALGFDEFTLRLLSVVFGVIAVAATYAVARRYGVGLLAALLLAVAPFFVHYEQETRVYTLLVAWSAICTLAYLRLVERPNRWRAAVYVVTAAALIYVHPLNAWLLVAHAAATLITVAPPLRWRLLALYVPVLIAALPMARFVVLNQGRVSWIPPVSLAGIGRDGLALSGGVALALALAIVLAVGALRLWRVRGEAWSTLRLPILWIVLLPGGVLAMSLLIRPLWVDRYLIALLVPLFIIVAWVIRALPYRWAIIGVLVALSLIGVGNWYVYGTKDDWRSAAAYVEARVEPADGFIIWPNYYRIAFGYYYAYHAGLTATSEPGVPIFPPTPWQQLYLPFLGISNDLPAELEYERIWLIRDVAFLPSPELAALLEPYDAVETRDFGDLQPRVDLLVRRP